MRRFVFCSFNLLFFSLNIFAQTGEGVSYKAAPVKWESYKITDRDITLNFPKLPTKRIGGDRCSNLDSETFGAYAKQRAYIFKLYTKSNEEPPKSCSKKNLFNEQSFINRKKEFDNDYTKLSNDVKVKYSNEVYRYSKNNQDVWLVNDYVNDSWYEFSVFGESDSEAFANFINTLERKSNRSAIEIKNGANSTIGDEGFESAVNNSIETSNMQVYYKPIAYYTEQARKNGIQGTVTLRVTFLANGSVGSVEVVTGLPNGLTEHAIVAARSIIFRPVLEDGKPQTVSRQVQYSFALY